MPALVTAIVSIALAVASLTWQIAQWQLSDGRARARLLVGVAAQGGVYSYPVGRGTAPFDFERLRRQGLATGPELIGVKVTNTGRALVTIDRVALRPRGGTVAYLPGTDRIGPSLPHRLEAGTNETWYLPKEVALQVVSALRTIPENVSGVYMVAELGSGKVVETRETLQA